MLYSICCHLFLFSIWVWGYYHHPSAYTKMVPALSSMRSPPNWKIGVAMSFAAAGDYFLYNDYHTLLGITSFGTCHLFILWGVDCRWRYPQPLSAVLGLLLLIASGGVGFAAPIHLKIPLTIYSLILSTLLISSVELSLYNGEWKSRSTVVKIPYLFSFGVFVFIISDMFVLNEMLQMFDLLPVGLPLYWFSLILINDSFSEPA